MNSLSARALHTRATAWRQEGRATCVVSVIEIKGSTPRDAGTRMLVSLDEVQGTIGGGHLEWQAIDMARRSLNAQPPADVASPEPWQHTFPLGPTLGQCCGGVVVLGFEHLSEQTLRSWPMPAPRFHLELHGAGHVGQAIVSLLHDIDCTVRWIDERADEASEPNPQALPSAELRAALPPHIVCLPTEAAHLEVADAPANSVHLVLTHRHDLDLRIVKAVLTRDDTAFVGMIGSRTKDAKFRHRLSEMGMSDARISRLHCPIGLPEIAGKEPAVIAISVVAQLLQRFAPQGLV